MENILLKNDLKILQEWADSVLTPIHKVVTALIQTIAITPIHMVAVTPIHTVTIKQNRTVLQGCANVVHKYRHTKNKTVT